MSHLYTKHAPKNDLDCVMSVGKTLLFLASTFQKGSDEATRHGYMSRILNFLLKEMKLG